MQNHATTVNLDPLLSAEEAAQYLNRDSRTMANDRCNGTGPRYARIGRLIRYRKSDLDAFIEASLAGSSE